MLDKRGDSNLWENFIFLVISLFLFLGAFAFVLGYNDGAVLYEDFYAKEIALLIDKAEAGTEFAIDVSKISKIAVDNGKKVNDIIKIDNVNNKVIVSLRDSGGTSFAYFNDADIVEWKVEQVSGGAEVNRFIFNVIEKQREDI